MTKAGQKDNIAMWRKDVGGFGHTAKEWHGKALFTAEVPIDGRSLDFVLGEVTDSHAYAFYHGHLLEFFAQHLSEHFDRCVFHDAKKNAIR